MGEPTIELKLGETAKRGRCGSCKFFTRTYSFEPTTGGVCDLKMPPHVAIKIGSNEIDFVAPTNRTSDTEDCSFWLSSGRVYIERHRIEP